MTLKNKSWALVGPGALGLYYGGLLAANGYILHVMARSDAEALKAQGIVISYIKPETGELINETAVRPESVITDLDIRGSADIVLIAAKSTVNEQLVGALRKFVEPGRTIILSLQNGMGNAEFYAKNFPENPILSGLCFVCVNRVAPGVVENYHPGRVEIGSLGDRWTDQAKQAVAAFEASGVNTRFAQSLDAALWRKLCWNVPFNGLSIAGGGITCDQILAGAQFRERAHRLMLEVQAIARHFGHHIEDSFLDAQFAITKKMGAYQPSSLIDYLENRPVEVDGIWGEPLRRGLAEGVDLPEMQCLYEAIKQLVSGR